MLVFGVAKSRATIRSAALITKVKTKLKQDALHLYGGLLPSH